MHSLMSNQKETSEDSSIEEPRRELESYAKLQHAAKERAIYLGTTPEEEKQIEERRKKIAALVDRLAALRRSRLQ